MSMDSTSNGPSVKRVAILGGGSGGVVMAEQLLDGLPKDVSTRFEPTIFERRRTLGSGLWSCDQDPGPCHTRFSSSGRAYPRWEETEERHWPPGAMYEGLKTNISADLMTYRDNPFGDDVQSPFPSRGEVEKYLLDYAEGQQEIVKRARLNTAVTKVRRCEHIPAQGSSGRASSIWQVDSVNLSTGEASSDQFDYIVLANGRCNVPAIPPIVGLWNFQGRTLHSAWYRHPMTFRGEKVVVVGNNSSGMDIAREIEGHIVRDFSGKDEWLRDVCEGKTGCEVINSVEDLSKPPNLDYDPREESSPEWSRRIKVVPRIREIDSNGVLHLEDGETITDVDTIVFATGFSIQYEFLEHTSQPFKDAPLVSFPKPMLESPEKEEALQTRLAQQPEGPFELTSPANTGPSSLDDWYLFYEADDSLAILGLPTGNVPFPLTHVQAAYVAHYWAGRADKLPPISRDLPPTDGTRWTQPLNLTTEEREARGLNQGPMPLVFGHPSDMDYLDAMLKYIRVEGAGQSPPWEKAVLDKAEAQLDEAVVKLLTNGDHGGEKEVQTERFADAEEAKQYYLDGLKSNLKGPEGLYAVAAWRRQRRRENKELRRKCLGY